MTRKGGKNSQAISSISQRLPKKKPNSHLLGGHGGWSFSHVAFLKRAKSVSGKISLKHYKQKSLVSRKSGKAGELEEIGRAHV